MSNTQTTLRLGHWLHSWVQPSGAIHGFHNHPIWGSNPYRFLDFTSGHTTFASPYIQGLARLLNKRSDPRAVALLRRLVEFQVNAVRDDKEFKHIGFQIGESLTIGLIHNACPAVALADAAVIARPWLAPGQFEAIGARLRETVAVLDRAYPNDGPEDGVCNQEYCRTWARMFYEQAFGDTRWRERSRREMHKFIKQFHRRGQPDAESVGCLRHVSTDRAYEPAEYYGLMIAPLVIGHQVYGDRVFLDEALALARHIVRSSWIDGSGQRRLHRHWARTGPGGAYELTREPMCICAAGFTLYAIRLLAPHVSPEARAELEKFIADMDATYAHYQHPAGFFLSATGWSSELDIAPSTGWHAHDFLYLAEATPAEEVTPEFWDAFFAPRSKRAAVLLGEQGFYIEKEEHWAVASYRSTDLNMIRGRKDRDVFKLHRPQWVPAFKEFPEEFVFPGLPEFMKTDTEIVLTDGEASSMDIVAHAGRPWRTT